MKVEKKIIRRVLERLYDVAFPESYVVPILYEHLLKEKELNLKDDLPIKAAGQYLIDRGLIEESRNERDKSQWRITALGINLLEGDLLTADPDFWVIGGEEERPVPKTRKEMLKQRYGEDYEEKGGGA